MSILIKNMEMPKNCWLCPLSVLYEKPREMLFCRMTKEEVLRNKVDSNCPIVSIPPHGRLIDADVLFDFILNIYKMAQGDARKAYRDVLDMIVAAGDVIGAEEGET